MGKIVTRLFVLLCVVLFAQLPLFVEQYMLRLEGHRAESRRQIEAFSEAASAGGKTLDQYIAKFLAQKDTDFAAQGQVMKQAVVRNQFLESASEALAAANPLMRPVVFVRYVDTQVLADAWESFSPGFLLTLNFGVWAGIGFVMGCLLLLALRGVWNWLLKR